MAFFRRVALERSVQQRRQKVGPAEAHQLARAKDDVRPSVAECAAEERASPVQSWLHGSEHGLHTAPPAPPVLLPAGCTIPVEYLGADQLSMCRPALVVGINDGREEQVASVNEIPEVVELGRWRAILVDAAEVHPDSNLHVCGNHLIVRSAHALEPGDDELKLLVVGVVGMPTTAGAGAVPTVRDEDEAGLGGIKRLSKFAEVGVRLACDGMYEVLHGAETWQSAMRLELGQRDKAHGYRPVSCLHLFGLRLSEQLHVRLGMQHELLGRHVKLLGRCVTLRRSRG